MRNLPIPKPPSRHHRTPDESSSRPSLLLREFAIPGLQRTKALRRESGTERREAVRRGLLRVEHEYHGELVDLERGERSTVRESVISLDAPWLLDRRMLDADST